MRTLDWQLFTLIAITLIAGFLFASFIHSRRRLTIPGDVPAPNDPWSMQSYLMRISGQAQPELPQVNAASLLYWALTLEEAGETGDALLDVLVPEYDRIKREHGADVADQFRSFLGVVANSSNLMQTRAVRLRKMLKDPFWQLVQIEPTRPQAKKLLDGTNDVSVVNCGFAQACGLPGRAGYGEVQSSNLSKANPATGRIDKTDDGKWIKGTSFVMPDMDRVLDEQAEAVAGLVGEDDTRPMPLDEATAARPVFLRGNRRRA